MSVCTNILSANGIMLTLTILSMMTMIAATALTPFIASGILCTMAILILRQCLKTMLHLKLFQNLVMAMHAIQLVPTLMTLELQSVISVRFLLKI